MVDPMGSLCVRAAARHRAGAPQRPAERCAVGAERGRARVFPGAQLLTGALGAQPRAYERRGAVRALQCRLPGLPCMCFASGRLGCCGRLGRLLLRGGRQRGGQGCPITEADTLTLVLIIPCAPACRRAPSCCWTSCRGCCPRCCAWSRPAWATRTPRRSRPRPRRPRRRRGRRRPRARRARPRGRAWRSARARPSRPARPRCRCPAVSAERLCGAAAWAWGPCLAHTLAAQAGRPCPAPALLPPAAAKAGLARHLTSLPAGTRGTVPMPWRAAGRQGWWWEAPGEGLLSDGGAGDERFAWATAAASALRNLALTPANAPHCARAACVTVLARAGPPGLRLACCARCPAVLSREDSAAHRFNRVVGACKARFSTAPVWQPVLAWPLR